jgi:valyl-tRNA synthetase
MVNWCPATQTALSDEEVDMVPQKGVLYKMRYEVVEEPGRFLEISTTRPETLMGDTGVAVHPADERYKGLVGKHVWRPFPRESIPIVEDLAIDIEFGTGVLKVTPAHDKVGWIGLRPEKKRSRNCVRWVSWWTKNPTRTTSASVNGPRFRSNRG